MKRSVIIHEATLLSFFEMYFASLIKTFSGLFLKEDDSLVHGIAGLGEKVSEENVEVV